MANDLNQCNFIGRLGGDPELRYSKSGKAVTNFNIACNYGKKGEEKAEWVRIVIFDKLAEIANEYLKKGAQVYISGRMQTRQWEKDGVTKYTTEIITNNMQMLGAKDGGSHKGNAGGQSSAPSSGGSSPPPPTTDDTDLPF